MITEFQLSGYIVTLSLQVPYILGLTVVQIVDVSQMSDHKLEKSHHLVLSSFQ